jgi:starch phosphorylase
MKAAANGALNLSIPDGWWAEAWTDHNRLADPIGWSIEAVPAADEEQDRVDAEALVGLLEQEVVPLYYARDREGMPVGWLDRVRASIRQLLPVYSTHRMVRDYFESSYLAAHRAGRAGDSAGFGAEASAD